MSVGKKQSKGRGQEVLIRTSVGRNSESSSVGGNFGNFQLRRPFTTGREEEEDEEEEEEDEEEEEGRQEAGLLGEEQGGGETETTEIFVCFLVLTFTFFLSVWVTVCVTSYGLTTNRGGFETVAKFQFQQ